MMMMMAKDSSGAIRCHCRHRRHCRHYEHKAAPWRPRLRLWPGFGAHVRQAGTIPSRRDEYLDNHSRVDADDDEYEYDSDRSLSVSR